jgi:predicted RNA-binding Zn-ribbon protein involved in translation (DUF1610 family)
MSVENQEENKKEKIKMSELFKCPKPNCGKEFDSEQALRMHKVRMHTLAGRRGAKEGARAGQLANMARGRKTALVMARASGPGRQLLKRYPAAPASGSYQCQYCDHPPYPSSGGLRYHLMAKHGNVSIAELKCPECGFRSDSKQGLNLHRSKKHGIPGEFSRRNSRARAARVAMEASGQKPRKVVKKWSAPLKEVRFCPACGENIRKIVLAMNFTGE